MLRLSVSLLVVASSCLLVVGVLGSEEHFREEFRAWLDEHRDTVLENNLDPAEIYPNWLQNADFVNRHNSLGLQYTLTLNKFAYKKFGEQPQTQATSFGYEKSDLPDSVDWRTKDGVVRPVIDQGENGDSKAIATVRNIEAVLAIQKNEHYDLSITEVANCCKNYSDYFICIMKMGGVAEDSEYPQDSTTCQSKKYKPVVTLGGAVSTVRGNETSLAEAVVKQPVSVGVDSSRPSFELYKSGVYSDPECSPDDLDHWMLVVGYGTYEGKDYWLCQNSWGSSWGMDGFVMMERNTKNMCGIASFASYPLLPEDTTN